MSERTYRPWGSDWEGNVALQETKIGSGIFKLHPCSDGSYNAEDVESIVKTLIDAKVPVSGYSLWLGTGMPETEYKGAKGTLHATAAQFKALVKAAKTIRLVAGKSNWGAQPKLLFEMGEYTRRKPSKLAKAKPAPKRL